MESYISFEVLTVVNMMCSAANRYQCFGGNIHRAEEVEQVWVTPSALSIEAAATRLHGVMSENIFTSALSIEAAATRLHGVISENIFAEGHMLASQHHFLYIIYVLLYFHYLEDGGSRFCNIGT